MQSKRCLTSLHVRLTPQSLNSLSDPKDQTRDIAAAMEKPHCTAVILHFTGLLFLCFVLVWSLSRRWSTRAPDIKKLLLRKLKIKYGQMPLHGQRMREGGHRVVVAAQEISRPIPRSGVLFVCLFVSQPSPFSAKCALMCVFGPAPSALHLTSLLWSTLLHKQTAQHSLSLSFCMSAAQRSEAHVFHQRTERR